MVRAAARVRVPARGGLSALPPPPTRWMGDLNYRIDLSRIDETLRSTVSHALHLGGGPDGGGGGAGGGDAPVRADALAADAAAGAGAVATAGGGGSPTAPLVPMEDAHAEAAGKAGVLRLIELGEWTALMEADQLQVCVFVCLCVWCFSVLVFVWAPVLTVGHGVGAAWACSASASRVACSRTSLRAPTIFRRRLKCVTML